MLLLKLFDMFFLWQDLYEDYPDKTSCHLGVEIELYITL
jgi:hypothetical protein